MTLVDTLVQEVENTVHITADHESGEWIIIDGIDVQEPADYQ